MPTFKTLYKAFPQRISRHAALLCFVIASLLPLRLSRACGFFFEFSGYSLLQNNLVDRGLDYAPYYLDFENFYHDLPGRDSVQMKSNLQEWHERFCEDQPIADLQQVIYDTSVDELKVLRTAASSKKINVPSRLFENLFARHLKEHQCLETINYLIFAKRCEPHATHASDPWDPVPRNQSAMRGLIDEGLRLFKKTKSHYIKLRYAYQLVRLAHYAGDYERTLELYDFLLPKIDNSPSILEDWILGHQAGALMALGKNVEASYLYALIFQRSPSKRESAYRSFKIETQEDWHRCQLLCEDDPERATLYALRAHAEDSRAAEEMAEIYRLDPHNENLELLLVREIRELEKDFLGKEFNDEKRNNARFFGIPRSEAETYLGDLQTLVQRLAAEGAVRRPLLWRMANAYLTMLSGELFVAQDSFALLEPLVPTGPLREQLQAFQLGLRINLMDVMTFENEAFVDDLIHNAPYYRQNPYFPDFVNDRMAYVYRRDGHPGMAFRCRYRLSDLKPNPQLPILDDLLQISDSTDAEGRINGLHQSFMIDAAGNNIRDELLDMKGTLLMSQGKWEAALEVFRQIPLGVRDQYQFNPFTERFRDCVHCPTRDTVFYNKMELIEELFDLEYKAKSDPEFGALYFYRLGIAHYNLSYFGDSWQVMDYYRSGANWDYDADGVFTDWYFPYGNRENRDCSLALSYFERARTLAHDVELAAKATYMAARCEQNNYFISREYDYRPYNRQMPVVPERYRQYFRILNQDYANTAFYREIIAECKYFEAYSRK